MHVSRNTKARMENDCSSRHAWSEGRCKAICQCCLPEVSCANSMKLKVLGYSNSWIHFDSRLLIPWMRIRRVNYCLCREGGINGWVQTYRPSPWFGRNQSHLWRLRPWPRKHNWATFIKKSCQKEVGAAALHSSHFVAFSLLGSSGIPANVQLNASDSATLLKFLIKSRGGSTIAKIWTT